ncbi:Aldolase-type TIM barrel [Moorella glycerini]|uniref:Tryptophan synthase alpha chain n=1 Tax=Neomoorella stamsii TaxID=1266720 RepID=A0A9X7P6B5_9FIRM|nr:MULTISPECIES: tryptophan synthase subunit alpha [Moorella]PRR73037.1 Tryptophan synthase alpha chain [Moorella stamsii]CEP69633.1 Aldolase-type TIM barrel [Moorella glycerini]
MGVERIGATFAAREKEGRKALIVYLCAGDPSLEVTAAAVEELAATGVDIIELGVPFSDPVADGPVIQAASTRALAGGTNLRKILDLVKDLRSRVSLPLVLMSYYNPLLQYGLAALAADLAAAGVDGLIVPDLPLEESAPLREKLEAVKLAAIPLVAPTTPAERLQQIAAAAQGFIYCVSLTGVTGARESLPPGIAAYLARVRETTDLPLGVGFGISHPEQARLLAPLCDGIIVGSAVVQALHEGGLSAAVEVVQSLRQAI